MKQWYDEAIIEVISGRGARGCESYQKRTDRKRVPHGGNGGKGGDVWIETDRNVTDLMYFKFQQHFQAEDGSHGSSSNKSGRAGKDLILRVPCGTTVHHATSRLRIRELSKEGDRVLVAKGGKGGVGNHTGKPAQPGGSPITFKVRLDLKIRADVFLVGTPGSGKSTILHQLTRARKEDHSYPFSTKFPKLGVYQSEDFEEISFCELPSLAKDSHAGYGLGNQFLKHLQGARCVMWVVEPKSDFAANLEEACQILQEEIRIFNPEYLKIPTLCVVNKIDTLGNKSERDELEKRVKSCGQPVLFTSGLKREGMSELLKLVKEKIQKT